MRILEACLAPSRPMRALGVVAAMLMLLVANAGAQTYPAKPIRLIVPYPAGGPADVLARLIGQKLTEKWGQAVLVDNRGGANTIIGMDLTAKAAPDGYTLVIGTTAMATNPGLVATLPFDGIRDFAPITNLVYSSFVLVVHPSVPANSVQELIALGRARPGQLSFGSGGTGSPTHLSGELFKTMTRVDMVHIAYKGMAPALADLLAGQIQVLFSDPLVALPHVKSGRLRALGVTSAKRFASAPEIPTIAEAGLSGYESGVWYGVLAPAGTPPPVIGQIHSEIVAILALPEVKDRLNLIGGTVIGDTPEAFAAFIKAETAKWTPLARTISGPPAR